MAEPPRHKWALHSQRVRKLLARAEARNDFEHAALYAVGRLRMFRAPSECAPLETEGAHSSVAIECLSFSVSLVRRKPDRRPAVVRRECCCNRSG
eukprot:776930-Pyramimonas_sp.AAC.1